MSRIDVLLAAGEERTLAADVREGLARPLKELPAKHLYDARGSELFERICALPEYYPTRAERAILRRHGPELLDGAQELVELGSGSAEKARLLLAAGGLRRYVPVDVSESAVRAAAAQLEAEGVDVHGVVGDLERHLDRLPPRRGSRVVAFLGGTIGNFAPPERRRFLRSIAALLGPGDRFLLGTDLVKDPAIIEAAYNDATGVSAAFNRNVLAVVNRELGADFDLDAFAHVAFFDREREWMEMRLRARAPQAVTVRALGLRVDFAAGEDLRTEISAKFTRERLEADLGAAGLRLVAFVTDPDGLFGASVSVPMGS